MLNRIASLLIITSMMLHCASRLGILSYVYENRNSILFHCGLIKEIPMSVCSSAYDFQKGLKIVTVDDGNRHSPSVAQAQEIDLFFVASWQIQEPLELTRSGKSKTLYFKPYLAPVFTIFHPPLS